VINTGSIATRVLGRYRSRAAQPVENDIGHLKALELEIVAADLLRMRHGEGDEKIRHDPGAIAAVAIELAQQSRRRKRKITSMKAGL
jgi:hypothetical protein